MHRRLLVLGIVALLAAGCGGGGKKTSASTSTTRAGATTTTVPPSTTASPATTTAPAAVKLHAYGVRLANSEESDNAFRVQVHSPASNVTVVLKGGLPAPNQVVQVCPAADVDSHGTPSKCATPTDGEPVQVDHGPSLEAIEVIQLGVGSAPGGAGNSITIDEIEVSYTPSERSAELRLPPIDVPLGASVCKDNGCNPFFEVTPFAPGTVTASAKWQGTDNGQLTLEAGNIAAHGQSATGESYNVIAIGTGGPGISISGSVPKSEWAVALRNTGASPVVNAVVKLSFP